MRQLGKIKCLEKPCLGKSPDEAPWIIMFHGFGANAADLQSLADVIPGNENYNWLFPDGFLEVPLSPFYSGRAWWNIDLDRFQQVAATGDTSYLANTKPEGLEKARTMAMEMIRQLKVPWNQIILGGFSQGSMLATDLFLNAPETPKGLAIFSGALINKAEYQSRLAARAGSNFFMTHGKSDAVLSHKGAQQLETMLCQGGLKGGLFSFEGGHEIPMSSIQRCGEYLKKLS